MDQNILAKLCENSRNISSSLSHDEDISSSTEPRSRYISSRNSTSSRNTPNLMRKHSKNSDEIIELAKTVQDGMADLTIIDDDLKNTTPDEMQKKMEAMKEDLMKKIKNNEEPLSRKTSALRRMSTEESIEEQIIEEVVIERPKSRGRNGSTVSFYNNSNSDTGNNYTSDEADKVTLKREFSAKVKKAPAKNIDKYCKDIIQDIEKTSKVIDVHMKQFSQSKFTGDKLVEQLQAVDKLNDFVNGSGDIPTEALTELNNNFNMLTEQVFIENEPVRKRSVSSRKNSRIESKTNLLGDSNMSNKDLLDDLLGKK